MSRPYTITIDTDDPHLFDLLPAEGTTYEATMTEHHPVTNAVVNTWQKQGTAPRSALADTANVGMQVVDETPPGVCSKCGENITKSGERWLTTKLLGHPGSSFCGTGFHEPLIPF